MKKHFLYNALIFLSLLHYSSAFGVWGWIQSFFSGESSEEVRRQVPGESTFNQFTFKDRPIDELISMAHQGDRQAQYRLAIDYINGGRITRNTTKGLEWMQRASEQGLPWAQTYLAFCHLKRTLLPNCDDSEAVRLLSLAARQGYTNAQYNLGLCYEKGRGVTLDEGRALELYQRAARDGDKDAQRVIGDVYHYGKFGISQNKREAFRWFYRAAEQGVADAQYSVGMYYKTGEGGAVLVDDEEAAKWLSRAAAQGHTGARMYSNCMIL